MLYGLSLLVFQKPNIFFTATIYRDAEGNLIVDPDHSELYCALAQLSALLYYTLSLLFSVLREVVQLSVLDEGVEGPLEAPAAEITSEVL